MAWTDATEQKACFAISERHPMWSEIKRLRLIVATATQNMREASDRLFEAEALAADQTRWPLGALNMPDRYRRALENGLQVRTVGQLLTYTEAQLLVMPGFGAKALANVRLCLAMYGLELSK